jgi:hypothetical protein
MKDEIKNDIATEYTPPGSNLPEQVSQRELLRQNENMGVNSWTAPEENDK